MIINDFFPLYKIKQNIKLLSLHSNTLPTIQFSNEITIDFCKRINQIGKMCQGVYIKKKSRTNNMNMCINCENLHWNKVKRVKRKWSNYDEQIKTGSHTKVVSLSPERLKKRIKNENHKREVSSLMFLLCIL